MSHMVIYRTADGQPGYHQAEELEDAVQFVERLRNTEGVDHPRIFRMEEVTFDFRPYFRVEIGAEGEPIDAPVVPPVPEPSWTPDPIAEPAPEPVPEFSRDPFAEAAPEPTRDPFAEAAPEPDQDPFTERIPHAQPLSQPLPQLDPEPVGGLDASPPPPPPPPAPVAAGPEVEEQDAESSDNGLGARRGLFGR